jgi:uncharacterized protein YkwD
MFRGFLLTTLIITLALPASAVIRPGLKPINPDKLSESQRKRASELFQQLQAHADDHVKRTRIIREIVTIGRAPARRMFDVLDRQWRSLWAGYKTSFTLASKKIAAGKSTGPARNEIAHLEKKVRSLSNLGKKLREEMIESIGDPALERLKELKFINSKEVLVANPVLARRRAGIIALSSQRNLCIDQLLLLGFEATPFSAKDVEAFEGDATSSSLGNFGAHLATLRANAKLASRIPGAEWDAIRDMNRYRMLIGLPPCAIDPRLCKAARGHSRDMEEKDFFSHTSPVPGKKSPWVRAKLEATTARSENIYSGKKDGKAANKSWWYSPGHHRNMLNPGSRRVGMGVHGKKWTQMFGN